MWMSQAEYQELRWAMDWWWSLVDDRYWDDEFDMMLWEHNAEIDEAFEDFDGRYLRPWVRIEPISEYEGGCSISDHVVGVVVFGPELPKSVLWNFILWEGWLEKGWDDQDSLHTERAYARLVPLSLSEWYDGEECGGDEPLLWEYSPTPLPGAELATVVNW